MLVLKPQDLAQLATLILQTLQATNKIPPIAVQAIKGEIIKEFDKANREGELVPKWNAFIKEIEKVLNNAVEIHD